MGCTTSTPPDNDYTKKTAITPQKNDEKTTTINTHKNQDDAKSNKTSISGNSNHMTPKYKPNKYR